MNKKDIKRLLILNVPYILVGLFATNLGEAWRLAEGADSSAKILGFISTLPIALQNPMPSFYPLDLLVGIIAGAGLRLAVYLKAKNAKKYRHNVEYGSARWGTVKDIEPFMAPKFEDNVILTKTERLMMSNRPKNPAHARNKNVLIIASHRALQTLENEQLLYDDELPGARKVLKAAALTYVAALLMSALQLLRYVLIFVGRNNRGRRDN